jgi:hypothetical protein
MDEQCPTVSWPERQDTLYWHMSVIRGGYRLQSILKEFAVLLRTNFGAHKLLIC